MNRVSYRKIRKNNPFFIILGRFEEAENRVNSMENGIQKEKNKIFSKKLKKGVAILKNVIYNNYCLVAVTKKTQTKNE